MELKIKKLNFYKTLLKTQGISAKKLSMPILSTVLLETNNNSLIIKATNLEVGINLICDAEIISEGKIAISSKSLFDIVKELPEETITIKVIEEDFIMHISCKDIYFKIMGVDWQEFPKIMNHENTNFSIIPIDFLKKMIEKTIFSISQDQTKPCYNGAFLHYYKDTNDIECLRMVTTDGRRLSICDSNVKFPNDIDLSKGIVIPYSGLNEILRNFDESSGTCQISLEKNFLILKENNMLLYMRLYDGTYPNYSKAIPKDLPIKVYIDKNIFLSSLKRVSLVADEKAKSIKIAINGNRMKIFTDKSNLGDAEEDIFVETNTDMQIETNFNSTLLIELLSVIEQEKVLMELKNKDSASIISPMGEEKNLYIVMPLVIKS